MAYQNVVTPRFYVNILEYLGTIGYTEINNVYRTNPTSIKPAGQDLTTPVPEGIFTEKSFVAYLGHKGGWLSWSSEGLSSGFTEIVNGAVGPTTNALDPDQHGFSIASFNGLNVGAEITTWNTNVIGSIVVGSYFDMPNSPDLNLKLSYEYDGVNTIQSKSGATLSNAMYTKPSDWGNGMGAWQLGSGTPNYRTGRRIWDLSFSYLSDTDVFPINASTSKINITSDGYNTTIDPVDINTNEDLFFTNVLDGTDFFSVVWNKTLGNALPFIFQPNKDNNNPDQFAICKFVDDTLQYERVAHNVYNINLKIEEVW